MSRLRPTLPATGTVIGGAVSALSGQVVVWALGLPTSILIARAVGAEGRGEYYLAFIAASVVVTMAHLSIETANSVAVAENRFSLGELSGNASVLAFVVGPVAIAAMVAAFLLLDGSVFEDVTLENYLIAAATVPFSLHLAWLAGLFVLAKQIPRSQVAFVVGGLCFLLGAALLTVLDALDVQAVLFLYASSVLVPWLLHVLWAREMAPPRPRFDRGVVRWVSRFGIQIHLGHVLLFLLLKFDVFLVSLYEGTREVGLYSLAVLVADLAFLLTYPLVQASIPFQAAMPIRESVPLAFKAARFNLALALVMSLGFAATMWFAIPLLYGDDFSDAYAPMLALLPGVCAMATARPLSFLLARQNRPLLYGGFAGAAFALNCVLNVILIPAAGIVGAGIASSIAYGVMAVAYVAWALAVGGLRPGQALLPQTGDLDTARRLLARVQRGFSSSASIV